jgi:glycosyltransferase involved in cell wall biosynthesis
MGFASTYLEERALFPQIIIEAPDKDTGIIVVVPAYNEPGINKLLDSLANCTEPECGSEVIIVINAPDDAPAESLENNRRTFNNIESWKSENKSCFFRLFAFISEHSSIKGWGVGLARKTGMDEAVRRFNAIGRPDGVILNLDADCTVEKKYFLAVSRELLKKSDRTACSIYFEHPLSGIDYPVAIYKYITLYELHLRYYFQGLVYCGFPYVYHTVGSAIAVKALTYIKAGGMNRRRAGEDFYFIQKLVPAGGYFNLNSTVVYPSPRASSRVPFGTGASIGKLDADQSSTLLTYNIQAFKELGTLFKLVDTLFACSVKELAGQYRALPKALRSFIDENDWTKKTAEIKSNTSGLLSFRKRFFEWFNMFKIVKYLNNVHTEYFEKKPVDVAASELLKERGVMLESSEPLDLLQYFRKLEKIG